MLQLVSDCPRCGAAKTTFDVLAGHFLGEQYQWQTWYDAFCVCRHCHKTAVFVLSQLKAADETLHAVGLMGLLDSVNNHFRVESFRSLKDIVRDDPPEHVPAEIKAAFTEGATCMAVECFNAAATMFRLCIEPCY